MSATAESGVRTDGPVGRAAMETVAGVELEMLRGGSGEPLLVLHDLEVLNAWQPFHGALAEAFTVLAPSHPGFGRSSLPAHFDSVDDLAYWYLDLLRARGAEPVHLVGLGLGGWIAAEVAVRCTHQIKSLVLVDTVGIKVGDRTTRDIADIFAIGPEAFLDLAWHDAAAGKPHMSLPGLGDLSEEALVAVFRNRQTAALLTWKPFMHNPKLRSRLARIDVPTLVLWGAHDRIVTVDYGRAFAQSIPGAHFKVLPQAGHYPYLEQPEAFVAAVTTFLRRDGGDHSQDASSAQ